MTRLFRLMEAIGHAHAYQGQSFATPKSSGRAASTAGRSTHQPTPLARRTHQ